MTMKRRTKKETAEQPASSRHGAGRLREVPAGAFKARCLSLLDRVRDRGEVYVVTKHGKPVARLTPLDDTQPESWGWMKGTVRSYDDLISPIDVAWEAGEDD